MLNILHGCDRAKFPAIVYRYSLKFQETGIDPVLSRDNLEVAWIGNTKELWGTMRLTKHWGTHALKHYFIPTIGVRYRNTISARLNLLIGSLFLIALLALAALLFMRGAERVQSEEKAMLRAAEFIVHGAVPRIARSADHDREIAAVLSQLRGLKHISVYPVYSDQSAGNILRREDAGLLGIVAKFFVGSERRRDPVRISFENPRASVVAVEIVPNPVDELREIIEEVADILLISAMFLAVVFAISRKLVIKSLQPLSDLQRVVQRMQHGDYDVVASSGQTPEFDRISEALTKLGEALRQAKSESRRLSAQLVSAQDEERKEIARELHDELGSFLFSIRAQAASLHRKLAEGRANTAPLSGDMDQVIQELDRLQGAHGRVLRRLSPPGLQELGLAKSLHGLVEHWRARHADKEFRASIRVPDTLNETLQLTVYRIVQEGVTNALKHAHAASISISFDLEHAADADLPDMLRVTIVDDGVGGANQIVPGFGLCSMEERVVAIGGALEISTDPNRGTTLAVTVPVEGDAQN